MTLINLYMKKYNFYIYLIVHFLFSAVLIVYISVQRYKIYFVQKTSSPLFCLLLDSFHVLLDLNKIMLLLYSRLNPPFVTTPSVISSHQSGKSFFPAAMTEFWLISAPGEKTCQQTWDKLMMATTRTNNLSVNNKFNIPDLKVNHSLFDGNHRESLLNVLMCPIFILGRDT